MQLKIKCPNKDCGKTLIVDSDMAGKKGKCSTCDAVFLIPGAPGSASPPGGSTVDLPTSSSGERKKTSKSGTQKTPKRQGGSKSGETKRSAEKYLDDYLEEPTPKKARASREELDDYAVEEVDYVDYADEVEEDRPRRSRRPERRRPEPDDYEDYEDDYDAPPRRRRSRRDEEYYEDDYGDDPYAPSYDEPYGAPVRRGGRSSRKKSGPKIGLIRAGFLIMAIAGCVFSGAMGIKILVWLIGMIGSGMGRTSLTILKIAEVLWMGSAIAVIVGYSFLLFFPNKNNSRGLTIAALCVGSINLIVQLVFKIIPMFSDGVGFLGLNFLGFGFRGNFVIEALLKIGLMEGLFIAEMVLVALAFRAINTQLKDRFNVQSAQRMIIPAGLYGGVLIVIGMFILILSEIKITSPTAGQIWKWVMYLMYLAGQGMLVWYFVSYILLMFNTRNAMPKS